jgi:hypothetical protein
MDLEVIWVRREGKYFCKWGWTSHFGKHEVICPSGIFCIAVIARSEADETIHACLASRWIASRSLSSGAHSRDPLARNDGEKSPPHQPVDETDARDGLSPSEHDGYRFEAGQENISSQIYRA